LVAEKAREEVGEAAASSPAAEHLLELLRRHLPELTLAGRRGELLPLLPVLAERVVPLALRGVAQDLVGLADLLELLLGLGLRLRGMAVGVPLEGELAVRLLDVVLGRGPGHAEHLVVVLELHRVRPASIARNT